MGQTKNKVLDVFWAVIRRAPSFVFYQCLESTSSGRKLIFFSVSYPTTMTMAVGVEEMIRADNPLVIPQKPSSLISCLKVSMTDVLPST